MRRVYVLAFLALLGLAISPASAHLCNDVFAQAKDNLAVKVDIRDGQLRIAKEASFRVYLLNTMDRDIQEIALEVKCPQFRAAVEPSPEWRTFPRLQTVARRGKKEYFEVKLTRKRGVRDGRYRIDLHLFSSTNRGLTFKTMELGASADACELTRAKGIRIDGVAGTTEWKKAALVTGFYAYVRKDRFYENVRAEDQPRYRLACDDKYLYALLTVRPKASTAADVATLHVAGGPDATPLTISFNQRTGEVETDLDSREIDCRLSSRKDKLEARIPLKLLGLEGAGADGFQVNFTRTVTKKAGKGRSGEPTVYYWRGNRFSLSNPIVYARIVVVDK